MKYFKQPEKDNFLSSKNACLDQRLFPQNIQEKHLQLLPVRQLLEYGDKVIMIYFRIHENYEKMITYKNRPLKRQYTMSYNFIPYCINVYADDDKLIFDTNEFCCPEMDIDGNYVLDEEQKIKFIKNIDDFNFL